MESSTYAGDGETSQKSLLDAVEAIVQRCIAWNPFRPGLEARIAHHIANANYEFPPVGMMVEEGYKEIKKAMGGAQLFHQHMDERFKSDGSALAIVRALASVYPHAKVPDAVIGKYDHLISEEKCKFVVLSFLWDYYCIGKHEIHDASSSSEIVLNSCRPSKY